jgi:hypothetical protein
MLDGQLLPDEEDAPAARDAIVSTSNGQQFGLYSTRMLRDTCYKYVWNLTDVDEFYDLIADPGEKHNLIAQPCYTERIHEMRHKLQQELSAHGDPFVKSEWIRRQLLDDKKHVPAHISKCDCD